jgi:hypothetical protein
MILYKQDRSRIESVVGYRWAASVPTDTRDPTRKLIPVHSANMRKPTRSLDIIISVYPATYISYYSFSIEHLEHQNYLLIIAPINARRIPSLAQSPLLNVRIRTTANPAS